MHYLIYKTINKVNGKFYIGCHKTENIDDQYLGSGKILSLAIEKYGKENFQKIILFNFDNPEDMFNKELELVNSDMVENKQSYNLKLGGEGGWDHIDCAKRNRRFNSLRNYQDSDYLKKLSESTKKAMKIRKENGEIPFAGSRGFTKGHKHSQDTKDKIAAKNKNLKTTKGRCWIHNLSLKKAKMIYPSELQEYLNQGWIQGNKRNFG